MSNNLIEKTLSNLSNTVPLVALQIDESVVYVTELSKQTLGSYIKKASDHARGHSFNAGQASQRLNTDGIKNFEYQAKKSHKRQSGLQKAVDRITKEDIEDFIQTEEFGQLDELSKKTLSSYINKANKDISKSNKAIDKADEKYKDLSGKISMARDKRRLAAQSGKGSGRLQSSAETRLSGKRDEASRNKYKALAKIVKRTGGIAKATDRLTKEDIEDILENINYLSIEDRRALVEAMLYGEK